MRIMNKTQLHKKIYNELAEEYERRAVGSTAVDEDAMNYFSVYIKPGGSVLDVGCGVGKAMNILAKKGFKAIGIDISPKMAEFAKRRNPKTNVIIGDFLTVKFEDKFDAVLTFAFIHLFPKAETQEIFEKIKSILKPYGVALISSTESIESKEGIYAKEDFGKEYKRFRKFWTERELRESLVQSGFKVLAMKKITDPFGKTWMDFVVRNE
jgi:SAM-dependent methyltransferase